MTSMTKHTPTLKGYLTADMIDDPMTFREWQESNPYPLFDRVVYRIEPFRPIYGTQQWPTLTYPYTIPYKDS